MRRDTLVFTAAGVVFGLVVGYMAASWDVVPRPAAAGAVAAAPAAPAAAPAKPGLNPDEAKALESLAARQPGDAAVRVELGNLHMDAERWDEADPLVPRGAGPATRPCPTSSPTSGPAS